MLCQTKGVSICPHRFRCHHMLGYHLYVGMPPLCLDAPIGLDAPPVCLNATLCLHTPHMFGHPLYVWMSPYVWTPSYVWMPTCMFGHTPYVCTPHMFGCPCMFGCPLPLDTPCMFGCPPYVWLPPVCLDVGIQTYGSVQNVLGASKHIRGYPNIWGHLNIQWVHPKILGHPNKWGFPNMEGDIQTCRGFPYIQGASKT